MKSFFTNAALTSIAILIVFAGLETALALFWPHKITAKPFYNIQNFFCAYDPVLGWRNKPGYEGVVRVGDEFSFRVTHNAKGARGADYDYRRTPGKSRVLVLGDSFAWGFGVEDGQLFSRLMEREKPGVEVVNLGVSGYGTDQELLMYLEEGHKYQPDLVLLLFYSNDISEISSSINYGYPKPYAVPGLEPLSFDNVPVPRTDETERRLFGNPTSRFGRVKKFLRRSTHSYPFVVGRLNSVPAIHEVFIRLGLAEDFGPQLQGGMAFMHMKSGGEAEQMFERLVLQLRKEAAERGAGFMLVHIPVKEAPAGNPLGYRGMLDDAAGQNDFIDSRLTRFCAANGIGMIDLLAPIRAAQLAGTPVYAQSALDIHFSRQGHELLAAEILRAR